MSCEIQPARHNHQPTHQQGTKCMPWPKLTKNANFGPNLTVFWPKIHFLGGWSKAFGILISGNQRDTFSVLKTLNSAAPIGHWGRKCAILTKKTGYLGQKVNSLNGNWDFCQRGILLVCLGLQLSHWDHPPKKFRFLIQPAWVG